MLSKIYLNVILALSFICSGLANAESFLCVSEAGAGVSINSNGSITSETYNVSSAKYILSNSEGNWQLKKLGVDSINIMACEKQYMCRCQEYLCGGFVRTNTGFFTYYLDQSTETQQTSTVVSGRCSKI